MDNRTKGNVGENVACKYLYSQGFRVIVRNYMKKWGEIDIIAIKDRVVNFFEVKSVTFDPEKSMLSHKAEDNVHGFKRKQIRRMIETFFAETNRALDSEFYFHVLCVYLDMHSRRAKVKWIKNVIL